MIDFRAFLVVLAAGLVLLLVLQSPPAGDPFDSAGAAFRANLDKLPGRDISVLKMRHARSSPRYEVGVFGDSRSIQNSDP